MKKLSLLLLPFLILFVAFGQIPQNYYSAAEGKKQTELKIALSEIITNGYVQRSYKDLWTDFYSTDIRPDGKVWDMYSNCTFTFGASQCGNYSKICDCYNREHSVPGSWFKDQAPMYTDLFHLYPTDGYTNGKRSNFPFGEVGSASWTGNNGSKLGSSSFTGYTGTAFEPTDEFKGDFARTYFYMSTRYLNINFTHADQGDVVFTYHNSTCDLTNYAIALFLKWHRNDPVSEKEIDRNNAVYGIQNNRNPYIDYPELVEHIWGNLQDTPFQLQNSVNPITSSIKISKCYTGICIEGATPDAKIEIYSIIGQNILTTSLNQDYISLTHLKRGVYIIKINGYTEKIIW
jgi:endonuclease I